MTRHKTPAQNCLLKAGNGWRSCCRPMAAIRCAGPKQTGSALPDWFARPSRGCASQTLLNDSPIRSRSGRRNPTSGVAEADGLDRLLDLAGPTRLGEPAGARARLMQRISAEPQLADDIAAPPPLVGLRGLLAAGMLAASLVLGAFIGLDTEIGNTIAASIETGTDTDEVLDLVLADPAQPDDGGVL